VGVNLTDQEIKYFYDNPRAKKIHSPTYRRYKEIFTKEIVDNTGIRAEFKNFKNTAAHERYLLNAAQFSAAKSAAEAKALQAAVFNEKGEIKPFSKYKKDADEITEIQQKTWLRVEYETCRRNAVQGDQFRQMQKDRDLYPYWIYIGVMDARERPEHVALEKKVFRIGDPAGDSIYPPNGWNCRCKGEPVDDLYLQENNLIPTPPKEAAELLEKEVNDQFRYNPAKSGTLPKKHSYFEVLPNANKANYELFDMPSSENATPSLTVQKLMKLAKEAAPQVEDLGLSIVKDHGGFATPINLKSEASITRKAASDYGGDLSLVKDSVRSTVIVPKSTIEAAIADLEERPGVLRVKRQLHATDPLGYSGNIANFQTTNRIMAEVQVNTAEMIYAKEKPADAIRILGKGRWKAIRAEHGGIDGGMGYVYYEQWRVLDKTTEAGKIAAKEIETKSKKYYALFK